MELDSFDDIEAAFLKAEEKRNQGDLIGAYDSYWTILSQRLSAKLIGADMVIIKCLADLAEFFGQVQAADDLLNGLTGLYEEAGRRDMADFALLKRIHLALAQGSIRKADALLRAMVPRIGDVRTIQFSQLGLVQWEMGCVWPHADSKDCVVLFSQLHLAMGRLLSALGQYSDALVTLNRGLFHTGKEAPFLARQTALPLKLAIASAHLEKGDLATANVKLKNLKSELDERRQPEFYIRWLEVSGKLHLLWGEFGQALQQFKRVQEICHEMGFYQATLRATLNLAHVLIHLNQTSFAKELLAGTQEEAMAAGDSVLMGRATLLLRLAHARSHSLAVSGPDGLSVSRMRRVRQENTPDKVDDDGEKLFSTPQSANYLAFFEDRVLGFYWQLSRLDLSVAAKLLAQLKEVFQSSDSTLIEVQIKVLEGTLAYYQGVENQAQRQLTFSQAEINRANLLLDEVRPTLRSMGLKPELWQVQRILGWCRAKLNHPSEEQDALVEETNTLLAQLTESLSPADQAVYLLNKWTADEEYIAAEINQLQRLQAKFAASPVWLRPCRWFFLVQRLNALLEHIDRYKDALAKRTVKGRNAQVQSVHTFFPWQRLLTYPKNRVTLSFLVLPDRVLVVQSRRFFLDFRVIPATRLEVRSLVQSWHKKIKVFNGGRDLSNRPDDDSYKSCLTTVASEVKDIANALAELLEMPSLLEGLPKRTRALTIVPDDILHGFPFAAIVHEGRYLVEHYALCVTYESSGKKLSSTRTVQEKALMVGVSNGAGPFSPLPGVGKELHQVKRWLTHHHHIEPCTQVDSSANKVAVIDSLLQATLLHIACHGVFEHNRPDHSGLVLIPNSKQIEILSLRELSNLNLTGLRHATLSSCASADHFILPGRWIISLPETLWRSGAQSIVGCLWEVYDRMAVSFMTRFYDYLNRLPRDEALRRTQLDCLQGRLPDCGNIDTANPIYWAGFNLYGDYSSINFSSRQRTHKSENSAFQEQLQELEATRQTLRDMEIAQQQLEQIATQRLRQLQNSQQQVQQLENQQQELHIRFQRQKEELKQQVKREVVRELLDVVDGFELAKIQIQPVAEQQTSIHRGYEGIHRLLLAALRKIGVVPINATGQPFDPSLHEAVLAEVTAQYSDGIVISEIRRGYLLEDIVLRPAQVRVAIGSESELSPSEATFKDSEAIKS